MKNSSPLSFIISLCLHLALLAFIIFVPTDYVPAPDLGYLGSGLQYRGQISIGPPGERGGGTPRKGDPEGGDPMIGKGESIPKPDEGGGQEIKPIEKPEGDDPQQEIKPIEKQPDETPDVTKPDKPDVVKPIEKQPDDTAEPILKDPEKQENTPKLDDKTQKPADDKTKKPEDDKTKKPDDKTKKPDDKGKKPADQGKKPGNQGKTPTKKDLDSALADLGGKSRRGGGQSVDDALADLGGNRRGGSGVPGRGGVRGEPDGTGTGGSGPGSGGGYGGGTGSGGGGDGIGIYGAYEDSVVSRIRPNFSGQERADRRNFQAKARLYINPDGSVQNAEIITPSGNANFDAAVIRAIMYTKNLERPPSPEYQVMEIIFTSESLRN